MRLLIFIGTLLICFSTLQAQSAEEEMIRLKNDTGDLVSEEVTEEQAGEEKVAELKRGHWDFSVGTSFSFMKGYGSGMMYYAAPGYILPLSNRWTLQGGMIMGYYHGLNYLDTGESLWPGSYTNLAVYGAASYRMNDRLTLHGTGMKQLVEGPITPFTPYPMDDLSLGATYRIGKNISIGASVHMRNYNGYYAAPTFGSPFSPSPFGW
jgi:hypothetical protein